MDTLYLGSYTLSVSWSLAPSRVGVPVFILFRSRRFCCGVPGASGSSCAVVDAVAASSHFATAVSDEACLTAVLNKGTVSEEAAFLEPGALTLIDSSVEPSSKMSVNAKNGPSDASWREAVGRAPRLRHKTGADGVADGARGSGGGGGGDIMATVGCCGDNGSSGGGEERRLQGTRMASSEADDVDGVITSTSRLDRPGWAVGRGQVSCSVSVEDALAPGWLAAIVEPDLAAEVLVGEPPLSTAPGAVPGPLTPASAPVPAVLALAAVRSLTRSLSRAWWSLAFSLRRNVSRLDSVWLS